MARSTPLLLALLVAPARPWAPPFRHDIYGLSQRQPYSFTPHQRQSRSVFLLHAIDADSLMEMDVVVYSTTASADNNAAAVKYLGAVEADGRVTPLSVWTTDPAFDNALEFVVDEEDRPGLLVSEITLHARIDNNNDLTYGSRQVGGGMGPGNPHGEESELLYYVNRDAVRDIQLVLKPELEIFW